MITSTSNKQVRRIAALQKKARLRRAEGVFLAEGIKMISQANPDWIRRIYVSENFWNYSENRLFVEQLQKNHFDISVEVAADHVFEAMSDTVTPQGIMCEVSCPHYELSPLLEKAEIPRLIILENIQDPGNLGTIMRAGRGGRNGRRHFVANVCGYLQSKDSQVDDGIHIPPAVSLCRFSVADDCMASEASNSGVRGRACGRLYV